MGNKEGGKGTRLKGGEREDGIGLGLSESSKF